MRVSRLLVKMSFQDIKTTVISRFSELEAQERYRNLSLEGLWSSEKFLYSEYFKKGSSVVDLGCGSGRTTFPLTKLGYKVVGIDLTPAMIRTAKKLSKDLRLVVDFRVGDATALDLKNGSFDNGIFSFCGWNQIPGNANRLKALEEAFRVLKSNGVFIFSSHIRIVGVFGKWIPLWIKQFFKLYLLKPLGFKIAEEEWGDRFFNKEGSLAYSQPQYTNIPSLKLVKQQIAEAGFELVYNNYRFNVENQGQKKKTSNCMFFVCKKV